MTARELAEQAGALQRQVVGRLQMLKRQGAVAFRRYGSAPSAPGRWTLTQEGRQETDRDTV